MENEPRKELRVVTSIRDDVESRRYSREELIENLRIIHAKLGKNPTYKDLRNKKINKGASPVCYTAAGLAYWLEQAGLKK